MRLSAGSEGGTNMIRLVEDDRCKSCGLCVAYCPQKCLKIGKTINAGGYKIPEYTDAEKCTSCGICYLVCPECAITVYK